MDIAIMSMLTSLDDTSAASVWERFSAWDGHQGRQCNAHLEGQRLHKFSENNMHKTWVSFAFVVCHGFSEVLRALGNARSLENSSETHTNRTRDDLIGDRQLHISNFHHRGDVKTISCVSQIYTNSRIRNVIGSFCAERFSTCSQCH